jgi:quercetin dioxygenase-like cupin family protein
MPAKVVHFADVRADAVPNTQGVTIRWVIGQDDGAPTFAMRVFEVQPGGGTPHHSHWWEHEVYILTGEGVLRLDDGEHPFQKDSVVYVPPDVMHQFRNTGSDLLRFICVVPHADLKDVLRAEAP